MKVSLSTLLVLLALGCTGNEFSANSGCAADAECKKKQAGPSADAQHKDEAYQGQAAGQGASAVPLVVENEIVIPPSRVAGSRLACHDMTERNYAFFSMACQFVDEAGERVALKDLANTVDFSYEIPSDLNLQVTQRRAPASTPYDVFYDAKAASKEELAPFYSKFIVKVSLSGLKSGQADAQIADAFRSVSSSPSTRAGWSNSCTSADNCDSRDGNTGLVWTTAVPSAQNWIDASNSCDQLSTGTGSDWRLPSILELAVARSDRAGSSNALKGKILLDALYWSSSDGMATEDGAFVLGFAASNDEPLIAAKSLLNATFCVHD